MTDEDDQIESHTPDDDTEPAGDKPAAGKASRGAKREADLILKTQVAELRRSGLTFKAIQRRTGIDYQRLGEMVREWLREALDLNPDSGQYILDLAHSRYEELYLKIFAAVMKADERSMQSQGFARLARLCMDIIRAECHLVARGAGGNLDDADSNLLGPDDVEGEARRLGLTASN